MSLPDLAAGLWRQRELLERLIYRLECEQLLLAAGRMRWLSAATAEVEMLTAELHVAELRRAAVSAVAARGLGLRPGADLNDLAAAAPPPWAATLIAHRESLIALTAELSTTAEVNQQLTASGSPQMSTVEEHADVNGDHEVLARLRYQRSERAAAGVITAADEMLETLVPVARVGTSHRMQAKLPEGRQMLRSSDVDLPMDTERQSTRIAYQAAIGAADKMLQTSLLDYLR